MVHGNGTIYYSSVYAGQPIFTEDFVNSWPMQAYSVIVFALYYVVPIFGQTALYGRIIYVLRSRQKSKQLSSSRVINQATKDLTKTAIVVSLINVISFSFDGTIFGLDVFGIQEYADYTDYMQVVLVLIAINSASNPFLYFIFLAAFRKQMYSLYRAICCRGSHHISESSGNTNDKTDSTSLEHSSSLK